MDKVTQRQRIIEKLIDGNWLSTVDMVNMIPGILRGGAYICDLRKEGWEIESRYVEGKHYSEYKLIAKPEPIQIIKAVKQTKLFNIKGKYGAYS